MYEINSLVTLLATRNHIYCVARKATWPSVGSIDRNIFHCKTVLSFTEMFLTTAIMKTELSGKLQVPEPQIVEFY